MRAKASLVVILAVAILGAALAVLHSQQASRALGKPIEKSAIKSDEPTRGGHTATVVSKHLGKGAFKGVQFPTLSALGLDLGDRPLVEQLAELEVQARTGNPDIGYALAMKLRECKQLDSQYSDLQNSLDRKLDGNSDVLTRHADALDKQYEQCKGLSAMTLQEYGQWVELAARRGSIAAQVSYPTINWEALEDSGRSLDTEAIEAYKSNTLSFLTSAADQGSVDALSQLAMTYQDGIVVPRDPIAAYAYEWAINQTGLVLATPKLLEQWEAQMTPEQILVGRKQGEQIHQRCCR